MVTSLYGSVRFFGVAFGPPIFGWLMGYGRPVMFWTGTAIAVVAALISFFFIKVRAIKNSGEKSKDNKISKGRLTPAIAKKPMEDREKNK